MAASSAQQRSWTTALVAAGAAAAAAGAWLAWRARVRSARLERVLRRINEVNERDPNLDQGVPKELLYSQRMSEMLAAFVTPAPPSDLLQIAARAQHIARWQSPRSSYPEGRAGYLKWRSDLYEFHGRMAHDIMLEAGYGTLEAQQVKYLLSKKGLKSKPRDADSQTLEDVVCLVFLRYYWKPFSKRDEFDEAKLISIVQKTWAKMSDDGHAAALKLPFEPEELSLIQKALA